MKTMRQFIAECAEAGKPVDGLHYIALPCVCEAVEGPHWARVMNTGAAICDHLALHSPTARELMDMGHNEPLPGRTG